MRLSVCAGLAAVLCLGCHSGPVFTDGSAYRAIEREAEQNNASLAVTGANIAAVVDRIDSRAERVELELDNLEASIRDSGLTDTEKGTLLDLVAVVQEENTALRNEAAILREDAGRLNALLAEHREISAALSEEHDRMEAAALAVQIELGDTKEDLAKAKGQRNALQAILITAGIVIVLLIIFKALRTIKIIPI
jgi:chromosome segregation ATPase